MQLKLLELLTNFQDGGQLLSEQPRFEIRGVESSLKEFTQLKLTRRS